MNKASVIKVIGTIAATIVAGGAAFLPEIYRPLATAAAGLVLGWLHLPQPKAAS